MTTNVCRLRNLDFLMLREPRNGYPDQLNIQASCIDLATTGIIHYSLHPGMLIRYIKGEYLGESRDMFQIIKDVLPYINKVDVEHIEQILTKATPLLLTLRGLQT
jgi:hypothetical protein